MENVKKLAALLAVTAMVLTGCSSNNKETEKPTEKATTVETQAAAEEAVSEAAAAVESEAAALVETALTEADAAISEVMTEAEEAAAQTATEAEAAAQEVMTEAEEALEQAATEEEAAAKEMMTEAEEDLEQAATEAEAAAEEVTTEAEADMTEAEEAAEVDFSAVETVSEGKLIVGTEAGFAPYEYLVGDKVEGIDMDIAQAIADALGVELEVQNMDFDGALLAVQQGKVDIVAAGVSVSEERENVMDFSVKYVDSRAVVVVNAADPKVEEPTADGLADKVVGVQQGNIADLWVSENAAPKSVQRYTKFVQAAQDLANGKIDCIVMDEAPAQELVASSEGLKILEGEALFEDSYAIAIRKGNDAMKAAVDAVITGLQESGEMDEIIASHSSADSAETEADTEA